MPLKLKRIPAEVTSAGDLRFGIVSELNHRASLKRLSGWGMVLRGADRLRVFFTRPRPREHRPRRRRATTGTNCSGTDPPPDDELDEPPDLVDDEDDLDEVREEPWVASW